MNQSIEEEKMIIKFGAQRPVYVIDTGHAIIRTFQKDWEVITKEVSCTRQ